MSQSANLSWDAICRRAGGRRRYNRTRQIQAEYRLTQVVRLLDKFGFCHGYQTRIAEELGVSRSTICRDIARLFRRHWGGKEAKEQYQAQQQMEWRIRAEDKLERDRMASEEAASEGDDTAPASPGLNPQPPTIDPEQAMFVPRRVSSPRAPSRTYFGRESPVRHAKCAAAGQFERETPQDGGERLSSTVSYHRRVVTQDG